MLFNLLVFFISIGLIIFVHEYGHYYFAKKYGVKVHVFSIGFGKSIYEKIDKNGVNWAVRVLPLGGYVALKEKAGTENLGDSVEEKANFQKFLILLGGPLFNIIFAFLIFSLLYILPFSARVPQVGGVIQGSLAEQSGLKKGDIIKQANGAKVNNIEDFIESMSIWLTNRTDDLTLTVSNQGVDKTLKINKPDKFQFDEGWLKYIGIAFTGNLKESPVLNNIEDNQRLKAAGIKNDDKIISIDHIKIQDYGDLATLVPSLGDKEVEISYLRDGKVHVANLKVDYIESNGKKIGRLGVTLPKPTFDTQIIDLSVTEALEKSAMKTWEAVGANFQSFSSLFIFKNDAGLAGPIGISEILNNSLNNSKEEFIKILAILSISLGVFNLLPIPPLDGGRIMFLFYESIAKKKINFKFEMLATQAGFVFVLATFFVGTVRDVGNLFK